MSETAGCPAAKAREIRDVLFQSYDMEKIYEGCGDIARALQKLHGDKECRQTEAFHILIGSTPRPEACSRMDFPGPDSIVHLLTIYKRKLQNFAA